MSSDPWAQILDNFFNLYERRAQLLPQNQVAIEGFDTDMYTWAHETLDHWKNVKLVDVAVWQFNNKRDAKKFITLFNLKWAR
jgi:hypothetical protein